MDLFIAPEIKRRQENGELPTPFELKAAQIVFFPDNRKPEVRINSEIKAIGKVKLKAGVSKKKGDPIHEHEVEGLKEINLTEEDDPDCAHATLIRLADAWIISFDFRHNKGLSKKHVETAKQFYECAEFSLGRKNWTSFVDNLFSAAELVVKSVLLSFPDPIFRKKATHKGIHYKYNRFADLGNVKPAFRETFNKLYNWRACARYIKKNITISEDEARKLLNIVKEMIEDASHRTEIH